MKNLTKKGLIAVALAGVIGTYSVASINAYAFDETTKGAELYSEFQKGDCNPYWFEEDKKENAKFAYEAESKNTPLYREFSKGDFNPYWFEEDKKENAKFAYEAESKNTPLYREFSKGDFNPYWFEG